MRLTIFELINKSTKFNAQGNNKKGMFAQLDVEQWPNYFHRPRDAFIVILQIVMLPIAAFQFNNQVKTLGYHFQSSIEKKQDVVRYVRIEN